MRKITLLLIVLLLALPVAAQDDEMGLPDFLPHTECEVDLSGQTITIYHLGDVSSPGYSPITLPLLAGIADAAAYYNAHGGVCGAEITQVNFDTGGDPAQTSVGYEQLKENDPDLLVLYSSQDSELLRPTLIEDQIPVIISAGSIPGLYGESGMELDGWIYATNPLYADQFADFCDFVADNPDTFGEEPVIGYMGWGGPFAAFGLAAFTDETIAHCEMNGVDIIDEAQTFLPTATAEELATLVENLVLEDATIIYVNALATGPVRVAEAIEFIGLSDELELATVNWGMDSSVALLSRASLGEDGLPLVNGMYGSMPFGWWTETDDPAIQLIIAQADANERDLTVRGISYILGWTLVDSYVELYTVTANRIAEEQGLTDGGEILEAIDGVAMRETIENHAFEPMGLFLQDFEGGTRRSVANNRIVQLRFANATMDGIATSGDDALKIDLGDGTNYYPPVIIQLTEFGPAPDMRPGMMDEE
ncbi:MAG: hypothetical protein Kow00117_12770 [Phototrophicales bacterium]